MKSPGDHRDGDGKDDDGNGNDDDDGDNDVCVGDDDDEVDHRELCAKVLIQLHPSGKGLLPVKIFF